MTEAVYFLCVWATVQSIDFQNIQVCSPTSRKEVGRRVSFELQVLQIVVVTCHVEVNLVLAK
jgi:hypothetical protein